MALKNLQHDYNMTAGVMIHLSMCQTFLLFVVKLNLVKLHHFLKHVLYNSNVFVVNLRLLKENGFKKFQAKSKFKLQHRSTVTGMITWLIVTVEDCCLFLFVAHCIVFLYKLLNYKLLISL